MKLSFRKLKNRDYAYEAENEKSKIALCASDDMEAGNEGLRPTEALLSSLAGCMSIDIMMILRKQRQEVEDFRIDITAEKLDATPAAFKSIHFDLYIDGKVDAGKLDKAITLSREKYCSVYHSLNPNIVFTVNPIINAGNTN